MKKILAILFVAIFAFASVALAEDPFCGRNHQWTGKQTFQKDVMLNGDITISDSTSKAHGANLPVIIYQGSTQTSATNATETVTGSSLTFANGWLSAGKTIKWTLWGTCSGGNAVKNVILYIDDAAIVTLATANAADTGDWKAEFVMHEYTDFAHQDAMGILLMNGKSIVADYATDTTDFEDGNTTTVKCQIQSQDASDTITVEHVLIEYWEK